MLQVMANSEDDASMLMSSLRMDMDEIIETLRKGFQAQYILMHANKRLVFKLAHTFGFDKMVPFEDYVMVSLRATSFKISRDTMLLYCNHEVSHYEFVSCRKASNPCLA